MRLYSVFPTAGMFSGLLTFVLVAGCAADPRVASKENFQRAIDAKAGSKLCLREKAVSFLGGVILPYHVLEGVSTQGAELPFDVQRTVDPQERKELDALLSAGLVTEKHTKITVPLGYEFDKPRTTVAVRIVVFDQSVEFAKYASKRVPLGQPVSVEQLCFASVRVDHVDNFTEPGQLFGATMSSVNYHAKVVDMADWANAPKMRDAFPSIATDLEQATTVEQSTTVVLMSDGWRAQ